MFYLETKDGDRFFTDKDSSDKVEFEKIVEAKMGKDSADLYNSIVQEFSDDAEALIANYNYKLKEILDEFDSALCNPSISKDEMESILSDLQSLYTEFMWGTNK